MTDVPPIENTGNVKVSPLKVAAAGGVEGPAMQLLKKSPSCPTAIALDAMVYGMRAQLTELTGGWTPSLVINRAQSLIDAEMRLGTGGDVKGVATQVAALMLIALEKLELETT